MKRDFYILFLIAGLCIAGCRKYERRGEMERPGIALTFDDYSIDNWYSYLPLLDSFGAKATFYISNYHLLTPEQKNKLREIERHGNEIAYHTTFHSNLCAYLNKHGIDDLIQMEICQDQKKMNRDGFYPTSFAYPFGAHNLYLDNELLKRFKSVRALNGTNDLARSATKTTNNSVLYALGMDSRSRSFSTIEKMMELASKNKNCLVLVGHLIEKPDAKFQVPYEKLKSILKKAQSLNMRFYRVAEISD